MLTKERVTATGDFLIAAWNDVPVRDALWGMLRDRVAQVASARPGWALTSDPEISRGVLGYFVIDDTKPEPVMLETTQEDAEFVKLQMSCWSAPKAES